MVGESFVLDHVKKAVSDSRSEPKDTQPNRLGDLDVNWARSTLAGKEQEDWKRSCDADRLSDVDNLLALIIVDDEVAENTSGKLSRANNHSIGVDAQGIVSNRYLRSTILKGNSILKDETYYSQYSKGIVPE